jgi:hypothetical protein
MGRRLNNDPGLKGPSGRSGAQAAQKLATEAGSRVSAALGGLDFESSTKMNQHRPLKSMPNPSDLALSNLPRDSE